MDPPLETAAPGRHHCTTCGKTYSTNSHLRRHEATHTGRQDLTCPLCSARFTRRDLAQRHVQHCASQGQVVILPTLKRGKKRMSCYECSQRKISCDAKRPCMRCRSRGANCTFENMDLASASATSCVTVNAPPARRKTDSAETGVYGQGTRISVDFLLNFTDPSGYRSSAAIAAEVLESSSVVDDINPHVQPFYLDDNLPFDDQSFAQMEGLFSTHCLPPLMPRGDDKDASHSSGGCPALGPELMSTLEIRAKEMVSQLLSQQALMRKCDSGTQTSFEISLANSVFTAANLRQFIWRFFRYFHSQFPILHRASFDIHTVSLPLLLIVALFGSMACQPSDTFLTARRFFEVAEAFVFDHLMSSQMLQCFQESCSTNDNIEILQAGLLALILQNNSNDLTVRRRLRLQRAPHLIAAVRASGLFAYRRKYPFTGPDRPEWQLFVLDEVRVRLAVWTFMTDSLLATFFNNPPQVAISEMTVDLPYAECLYKAETALEFKRVASTQVSGSPTETLFELVSSVLLPSKSDALAQAKKHLTAPNMLVLICALQSVLTASRMNFLTPATVESLLRSLNRWKELWDVLCMSSSSGSEVYEGFERHAGEYWWLAQTILSVELSEDKSCRYIQPVPSDSVEDLHNFIRKYRSYVGQAIAPPAVG
ncbi:hypothetical protein SVAN01_09413 [Stagonosporopsis vannaccii]|nr:hypothetical protein SVAN01_09413 [Stagonosporopsis vannaccii]